MKQRWAGALASALVLAFLSVALASPAQARANSVAPPTTRPVDLERDAREEVARREAKQRQHQREVEQAEYRERYWNVGFQLDATLEWSINGRASSWRTLRFSPALSIPTSDDHWGGWNPFIGLVIGPVYQNDTSSRGRERTFIGGRIDLVSQGGSFGPSEDWEYSGFPLHRSTFFSTGLSLQVGELEAEHGPGHPTEKGLALGMSAWAGILILPVLELSYQYANLDRPNHDFGIRLHLLRPVLPIGWTIGTRYLHGTHESRWYFVTGFQLAF